MGPLGFPEATLVYVQETTYTFFVVCGGVVVMYINSPGFRGSDSLAIEPRSQKTWILEQGTHMGLSDSIVCLRVQELCSHCVSDIEHTSCGGLGIV